MKETRYFFMHLLVYLTIMIIMIPLLLLLVWCFVSRWSWPDLLPATWTLRGVHRLTSDYIELSQLLFSSILLSLVTGLISTIISAMAARAFTCYHFYGKRLIKTLVFMPIVVPATVFGTGIHMVFIHLHLNNTRLAVILSHLICTLPYGIQMMNNVTKTVSLRWEEQATVLGASPITAFLHGSLPMIAPGLFATAAVSFLMSYSQYFLTLLMGGGKVTTMAVLVMPLIQGGDRTIASLYCILFILSSLIVFIAFQHFSNITTKWIGSNLGL